MNLYGIMTYWLLRHNRISFYISIQQNISFAQSIVCPQSITCISSIENDDGVFTPHFRAGCYEFNRSIHIHAEAEQSMISVQMVVNTSPVTIHDHTRLDGNARNPVQTGLNGHPAEEKILHRVTFETGGGWRWIGADCLT